ncbi:MAG TPA: BTAD domain-containing putative transcriptional regulator [Baekduia sp.]|nr:BTAD domain-containing putative transcriptional regulator [Baekduia sp.]
MDFRILGPLEVYDAGRPLALGAGKQRALLAILLLHANEVVSADRLIDELWGGRPPGTATKALQVHVSQLRKALTPVVGDRGHRLHTRAPGYLIEVGPDELDARRFERLTDEAARALAAGDAERAAAGYRQALALWRGPPLADVAYEPFAQAGMARLAELHSEAVEGRIEADLAAGRHRQLVGDLEALVQEHPSRERLRGQQMLCLYRSGRQAEALEAYRAARSAMVEDLGIEPGPQLRALHRAILRQDPGLELRATDVAEADRQRGTFVGRRTELAQLLAGLDDACAGRGGLFLLVGEPGVGKSRLAEELSGEAAARGMHVLVGRCWEAGGAPAHWPWVQALRSYVREIEPEALRSHLATGAADLVQLLPELRVHVAEWATPPPREPFAARFRLFDAVTEFLRRASERRPLLIVVDDLHAADAPSLLLLRYLARQLGASRILVVAATRDVDPLPGPALADALAELAREPVTRRISLAGLSEREVARYVEQTAPSITSSALIAALHQETGGNALFVGEFVRLLVADRANAHPPVALTIPLSVREVIGHRLARLSDACRRTLVLASVLGREFAVEALAQVAGLPEEEQLDVLDEALAARVLSDVPGGPGRLRFAHVLIRDALYDGISNARRPQLHRRALTALEDLYRDNPEPHLAELAHHGLEGGRAVAHKAITYAVRAARRAASQSAYEEAARLYADALSLLEATDARDDDRACELLLSLGDALSRSGSEAAARETFRRAAALGEQAGRPDQLARAAIGYGGRFVWGRAAIDPALVPLLEGALDAVGPDDSPGRVRLLARLAAARRDDASRTRRVLLANEAVAIARRLDDPISLSHALDGYASAVGGPDHIAEALAAADQLIALAQQIGDKERAYVGYDYRLHASWKLGDRAGIDAAIDALSRLADELRQPAQRWHAAAVWTALALMEGRFARAENRISEARELGQEALGFNAAVSHRLQLFVLRREQGRLAEVEETIRESVMEYPALPRFRCALAHIYGERGRQRDAHEIVDDLLAPGRGREHVDDEWLFGMSLLADPCAGLHDQGPAEGLYDLLVPYAGLYAEAPIEAAFGSVARALGILATRLGRFDLGERHFAVALATEDSMGAVPWLAHVRHDFAALLIARGGPGDASRALRLRDLASRTYRDLGMTSWAARVAALEPSAAVSSRRARPRRS